MGEDGAGTGEASLWDGQRDLRQGLLFQGLHQDAFQAADVDEVHLQSPTAGGVQALGGVALPQPEELVALANLGPGHLAFKKTLSEFGHRRPQFAASLLMWPGVLVV